MKFTNTQKGPRGLNTVAGPILVEAGQTVEVELSEAELASAGKTGWFEIEGEPDMPPALDRDDLKKQADELGLQYAPNIKTERLKELIDEKRAS